MKSWKEHRGGNVCLLATLPEKIYNARVCNQSVYEISVDASDNRTILLLYITEVECNPLPPGSAGVLMEGDGTRYQDTVTYACEALYIEEAGDKSRTCQADKSWSGEPLTCRGDS